MVHLVLASNDFIQRTRAKEALDRQTSDRDDERWPDDV
jgi:hypothetical protein